MDECKPLIGGSVYRRRAPRVQLIVHGWGLQSSTFQLNLSAFYGIGGVRRGYVARVKGVSGGV